MLGGHQRRGRLAHRPLDWQNDTFDQALTEAEQAVITTQVTGS